MTDKFTPGPWLASDDGINVDTVDGKSIAETWAFDVGEDQRKQNAALIAAAPELLQALESAIRTAEFESHPFRSWHEDARAAIAKARVL